MIRIIGILVGLGFAAAVLLWSFIPGAITAVTEPAAPTAEHEFLLEPKHVDFEHAGPFGTWDVAQLQRGYQVYKEVCSACHSMDYVALRNLSQLGYTEAEVAAEAASWTVGDINPDTGEDTTRPGEPTDYFPSPYANDVAASAANGGKVPPDLSLITKARHHGPEYVYSLLTGYTDAATYENEDGVLLSEEFPEAMPGAGNYFNPYFPALNIGMAPPLASDGQVTYADGTDATIDQMAKDVAAYLTWTAEPSLIKRKQTGWAVLGFIFWATLLAWFAKKQVWSAVKPKKRKED